MPPSTFRAVIAIVVVLLLINVYALTQLINPSVPDDDDNDDDDEEPGPILHPWNDIVDAQVITEDTTWTGRNGPLEAPLVIADGATLRLEDCHIELLVEDFIFFRVPYITVERGGRLEIVGSTVDLVEDPWLEHTLVGPVQNWGEYPYMSRVVNLTDTVDPVVSFDVKWKREGTRLAVAVQPTPESGLVILDTLEPTGSPSDWFNFNVSLSYYIGMDVNVVLYAPDFPRDILFIHDLMVMDGGVLLPHDLPLGENGLMQYWLRDEFITFDSAFLWFGHYSQLIFAEGDVVVVDSNLVSPEVKRRGDYDYLHGNIRYDWASTNLRAATIDWNIWLDGLNLTVRDSVIENIPVMSNDSMVFVESTRFRSKYDMVSLFGSSGTLVNSTFVSDGPSDSIRWWDRVTRALWAISVENNSAITPVDIVDCEFRGVQQAIDMGNAYVNVNGCEFQDVTNLTVWNHQSEGTATWEDLEANNVFRDGPGFLYLQTRRTSVEINASYISNRHVYAYDTDGNRVEDFGVHSEMDRYLLYLDDLSGWLTNPQVLVESKDRIRHIDLVNISVDASIHDESLQGTVDFNVSPYDESVYLDTYPPLKEQEVDWWDQVSAPVSLLALAPTPLCETAGTYSLLVGIYTNYLYAANVTIDFILDDVLVTRYHEWDPMEVSDSYVLIWENLTFGPGAHRLDLVVSGLLFDENMNLSEEPAVIGNMTHHLMRVNNTTPSSTIRGFLGNYNTHLLMDPGADIEVVGLEPDEIDRDEWQRHFVRVVGAENASLTLKDTAFDGKGYLSLSYQGPLDIHVTGGSFGQLRISMDETYEYIEGEVSDEIVNNFTIDNITTEYLDVNLRRAHLVLRDASNTYSAVFYGIINSSISIQRCQLYSLYTSIWGPVSSIVLQDCIFTGMYASGVRLATTADGNVRVSNSTFDGTCLVILRANDYGSDWALSVTDCEFLGDGAYLVVLWEPYSQDYWVYPPNNLPITNGTIEDNVFIGDGTGMLLHHWLYGGFLGDNQLDGGTRLWAWYMTGTQALCSDPSAGGKSELIVQGEPEPFEHTLGFYEWPYKDDYMIDVTEDPGSALDPPPRGAVLIWSHSYGRYQSVMGFGPIDVTLDLNVLYHPLWPDLQTILPDYVVPWPIPMDIP